MKHTLLIILMAGLLFGCSSAPKDDGVVSDIKNRAAEYAEFGNRYYQAADYVQALKFFSQTLEMNVSVDNEPGIVESHGSLGKVYMKTGDFEAAERHLLKAYELSLHLHNDMKLKTAGNLGEYWLNRGDTEKALTYIDEGLSHAAEDPESPGAAVLYHNAGTVYKHLEEYDRAIEYTRRALEINTGLSSYGEMAANYYLLSSIASKQDNPETAIEYAEEALSNDKKVENRPGIAGDLFALGLIYRKSENHEKAYYYFEKAYHVYEAINLVPGIRKALEYLADTAAKLDREEDVEVYTGALELLERASP